MQEDEMFLLLSTGTLNKYLLNEQVNESVHKEIELIHQGAGELGM